MKKNKKNKQTEDRTFQLEEFPEIFIGLVSPLGVDLDIICDELSTLLSDVGYSTEIIKLSKILQEKSIKKIHEENIMESPEDERIKSYMNAGNSLRAKFERNDALSLLSITQIRKKRKDKSGDVNNAVQKTAYILRSFKNKDEIETLRSVYGASFFVISVYSSKDRRRNNLIKRIKKSGKKNFNAIAEGLIQTDYDEEYNMYGQDVKSAFPLGDLFVNIEVTRPQLEKSIRRFIHSLFGYPYHTPTKNEFGMFLAFSAALRSADLSRQVGAAILNSDGDLLTIGCNEVPKYGGGQYWEDDDGDDKARDFEIGYDSSARMKKDLLEETINIMKEDSIITEQRSSQEIANKLLDGRLKNADISNLLEFGRMIHAEMSAISDAAKRGISLKGATLFCTTFPCHMCARHIISSGIEKVIYVEPYPKSKAQELWNYDEHDDDSGATIISLYDAREIIFE